MTDWHLEQAGQISVRSFNHFHDVSILTHRNLGFMSPCPRSLFERFLVGHISTVPRNIPVIFEFCSFFKTIVELLAVLNK